MPSYLTKKQKEAEESCKKMKTSFDNLKIQINVDHKDGAIPLNNRLNENQPLVDSQHTKFSDIKDKSTSLDTKAKDTLKASKDMNVVPSS